MAAPFPFPSLGIALSLSESDQLLHLVGLSEETERRLLVVVLEISQSLWPGVQWGSHRQRLGERAVSDVTGDRPARP